MVKAYAVQLKYDESYMVSLSMPTGSIITKWLPALKQTKLVAWEVKA